MGRLPVVNFAAGGLATPADVSLCMQLGVDGVFVGSGIFKSSDPVKRARAMVMAVTHYKYLIDCYFTYIVYAHNLLNSEPSILAEVSADLGEPMVGIDIDPTKLIKWSERESKFL